MSMRYTLGRSDQAEPVYEVRILGAVADDVLEEFGDVQVAAREIRTVLTGRFEDQAALYGFLNRLRTFGLEVVEVRRVDTGGVSSRGKGTGGTGTGGMGSGTTETGEAAQARGEQEP